MRYTYTHDLHSNLLKMKPSAMKTPTVLILSLVLLTLATSVRANPPQSEKDRAEGIAFFEKKIRPVLVTHCYKCHSKAADKDRGGLMMDTKTAIRKGGDSGDGIVPGDLKASLVYSAITYKDKFLQMPPNKKLPDEVG